MKRFLAMSGGGDRGLVLVGMLQQLYQSEGAESAAWERIAGISAGALTGCIISQSNKHDIQEHLDKLENLFFDKKFHVVENWVWGGTVVNVIDAFFFHESIFSNKHMKELLKQMWKKENVQRPFTAGAYNRSLCRYETFDSSETDEETMLKGILASASVPILLPTVEIDSYKYQDGGTRHTFPINEIKRWVKTTQGPKHVDVLVCFPINSPQTLLNMLIPPNSYPLIHRSIRNIGDVMLQQLQMDLTELGRLVNVSYEEIVSSNCVEFSHEDLTIRVLSPRTGEYSSFLHMNPETSRRIFATGIESVEEYITKKNNNK